MSRGRSSKKAARWALPDWLNGLARLIRRSLEVAASHLLLLFVIAVLRTCSLCMGFTLNFARPAPPDPIISVTVHDGCTRAQSARCWLPTPRPAGGLAEVVHLRLHHRRRYVSSSILTHSVYSHPHRRNLRCCPGLEAERGPERLCAGHRARTGGRHMGVACPAPIFQHLEQGCTYTHLGVSTAALRE